jgi:hypothetical protein
MSCSLHDRAHLRELLQDRLNGKASGFRDAHLDAMIKQGLTSEDRLARTSWSELSQQAVLPRMLVQALLEAYNSSALDGPGTQLVEQLLLTCLVTAMIPDTTTC